MAFYRSHPPANRQNKPHTCWAAALDSFSRVTTVVPTLREKDLIATYGDSTGALNNANLKRLGTKLADYGVRIDLVPVLSPMPDVLEERLRRSHVVLVFKLDKSIFWHAWVVYGVDNFIMYMDTNDGGYHKLNWTDGKFSSDGGVYLFWRP